MNRSNIEHYSSLKKIALAMALLSLVAMSVRMITADMLPITIFLGFVIISVYLSIYFFPQNDRFYKIGVWMMTAANFLGLFTVVYFSNGLSAPVAMVVPLTGLITLLAFHYRYTLIICCLTIVCILLMMSLELSGHQLPKNPLTADGITIMRAVWLIFVTLVTSFTVYHYRKQNNLLEQQLYQVSITDHLTGLYNRRYFDQFINEEYSRSKRNKSWLAVILIDIDHFKLYNDTYGHQAGDKCLQKISELLKDNFKRSVDRIIRYGGEEFIIVLPETDAKQAFELAELFRNNVKKLNLIHSISSHKILTVSIGIHAIHGSETDKLESLVQHADQAMYKSKDMGRNQTTIYSNTVYTAHEL